MTDREKPGRPKPELQETDRQEADRRKSDRNARIILIGLAVLAIVTIGGTIVSTMGEWNAPPPAGEDMISGNGDAL